MFYKPKYCCNCGEKVERVDWNILTSRRFCESCAVENKKYDYLLRIVAAGGILGATFGFGSMLGGSNAGGESTKLGVPAAIVSQQSNRSTSSLLPAADQQSQTAPSVTSSDAAPTGRAAVKTDQPSKTIYYCGALTKKGTPCSRKVKAAGSRCFQHEGKSAAPAQNQ